MSNTLTVSKRNSEIPAEVKVIYLVGGQKGGVGKTSICRSLCQYLLDHRDGLLEGQDEGSGRQLTLVEGDAQIDDVGRMYREQIDTETTNISAANDPDQKENIDVILELAKNADRDVVVNLPSNVLDVMGDWLKTMGIISSLKELLRGRVWLVKLFVTDGCYESVRQFEKSLNMLDNSVPHVLIRNQGRVNGVNFDYLDAHESYTKLLSAPNLIGVFDFPSLEPDAQFFVDKHGGGVRKAYEQSREDFELARSQRIKNFLDEVSLVFADIQSKIADWFPNNDGWTADAGAGFGNGVPDSSASKDDDNPKSDASQSPKKTNTNAPSRL